MFIVNSFFTGLAMFHLAYLGLMFSSDSHTEGRLEQLQVYRLSHQSNLPFSFLILVSILVWRAVIVRLSYIHV